MGDTAVDSMHSAASIAPKSRGVLVGKKCPGQTSVGCFSWTKAPKSEGNARADDKSRETATRSCSPTVVFLLAGSDCIGEVWGARTTPAALLAGPVKGEQHGKPPFTTGGGQGGAIPSWLLMSGFQTPTPSQQQQPVSPLSAHVPAPPSPLTPSPAPTPDARSANRAKIRLPPTIEPLLAPSAYSARQSFSQAIAADQRAALQPDYKTSFQSANDVVNRLLPYHVWHVNEDDLRWTMDEGKGKKGEGKSLRVGGKRKGEDESHQDRCYPTGEEAFRLFDRYSKLHARSRRLRRELTGGTSASEGAPYSKESLYNIEKLAVEQERELLAAEQEKLRQAKEEAVDAGVGWEALMRLGPTISQGTSVAMAPGWGTSAGVAGAGTFSTNGFSPISFQKSVGTVQAGSSAAGGRQHISSTSSHASPTASAPSTPLHGAAKGSKPRGRPRKTRDEDGKIIATPPTVKAAVTGKANAASPSVHPKQGISSAQSQQSTPSVAAASRPPLNNVAAVTGSAAARPSSVAADRARSLQQSPPPTASSAIPNHPIPLVLPLSTLAQLSSLGIAPVPAPHLLPAISAQQAQMQRVPSGAAMATPPLSLSQSIHSTAPRPAPANQEEPALLMGITEAPLIRKPAVANQGGASGTSMQQMLHVSVVLSKLSPSQLSGLAALMQSLHTGNGSAEGRSGSAGAADQSSGPSASPRSPHPTPPAPKGGPK